MISELKFVATHYLALAVLTLCSYVFGRQLTRRVNYQSLLEQASFSITLGLGVIAYLVLLLGLLRVLYPSVLAIGLVLGLAICYPIWLGWARELPALWKRFKASDRRRIALIFASTLILTMLAVPILILPLYPPTAFDATMYHLAASKIFVQKHQLVYTPYLRYPVLPQTNQMLFTLALVLYDDVLAQLVELLMMITLMTALVAFGRRYFSARAGLWAAALLVGSPLVLWAGSVALVETGVALFVMITIYAFWNWLQTRERPWLLLSAVSCGLAAGTKSPALFFLGMLTVVALYAGLRKRNYSPALLFASIAVLVASPWFARSFYYTGNPIFPLFYEYFGRWFGFGHSQADNYRGLMEAISTTGLSREPFYTLLWHLAVKGIIPPGGPPISRLLFLLLPLSIVVSFMKIRIRGLLALAIGYVAFWLLSVRDLRFLMPALPIISLVVAASISHLVGKVPWLQNASRYHAVTVLGIALAAYPGLQYGMQTKRERGPIPVTREQRDAYLSGLFSFYPAQKMVNDLKGANYTLYAMFNANMAYFADGVFMGDAFGPVSYSHIMSKFTSGEALHHELKSLGVNYFLAADYVAWPDPQGSFALNLPEDDFFRSHFKLVYANGNTRLFEVTDSAFERKIANLLINPSLDDVDRGVLTGWQLAGSPVVDRSGQQSFSGAVAVHCDRASDILYQKIQVDSGRDYFFSCEARGLQRSQTAKLQVNWLDAGGVLLREDIKLIDLSTEWKHYEVRFEAPARTASAIVYASPLDPSSVWFDDFAFGEVGYRRLP